VIVPARRGQVALTLPDPQAYSTGVVSLTYRPAAPMAVATD